MCACALQVNFKYRREWDTNHPVYYGSQQLDMIIRPLNFMDMVHESITCGVCLNTAVLSDVQVASHHNCYAIYLTFCLSVCLSDYCLPRPSPPCC